MSLFCLKVILESSTTTKKESKGLDYVTKEQNISNHSHGDKVCIYRNVVRISF